MLDLIRVKRRKLFVKEIKQTMSPWRQFTIFQGFLQSLMETGSQDNEQHAIKQFLHVDDWAAINSKSRSLLSGAALKSARVLFERLTQLLLIAFRVY